MSDPQPPKPDSESSNSKFHGTTPKEVIRKNLSNFLNPGQSMPKTGQPVDPKNAALQFHMAQMELANRMRLQAKPENKKEPAKPKPVPPSPGFGTLGSGHGVFQMGRANFGQKPSASRPSPYQQILANASNPEPEPEHDENDQNDVLAVPEDAEVKMNEKPKQLRGKKFKNPSL